MKKLLSKLGYGLIILFSVATLVFFLFAFSFPNPEDMMVGQRTDQTTIESIRQEYQLDQPMWVQYRHYLNDLSPISIYSDAEELPEYFARRRFGSNQIVLKPPYLRKSFQNRQPVAPMIWQAFKTTAVLAVFAMGIAAILGIFFGSLAALKPNTWLDRILLLISMAGISIPSFLSSIVLAWLFGFVLQNLTGLSMTGSLYELHPVHGKTLALQNVILPALALGVRPLSIITQLTRSSLLEVLNSDYIRTARAKGLHPMRVLFVHALPNGLNPVITALSGWLASLLAGSFFVEFIFNWNGLGKLTIEALTFLDLPVVMGSILLVSSIFILVNLAVDVIYKQLDPRIQ
jgi:peptide/nickel transport system permease protein